MAREPAVRGVAGRVQNTTPDLLRNLRKLRVLVFHPKDTDGELLTQQLQRIGCQVLTMWPPLTELPEAIDLLYCAVRPDHAAVQCAWMAQEPVVPLVAIINYENPTMIDAAMRMGALALLNSPLQSAGILSSLAIAQHTYMELRDLRQRLARMQRKMLNASQITQAKAILMRTRAVSDADAYSIIREQAMSKRVGTEEIARAIINADGILSFPTRQGGPG
ncbi:ANTAR domain-containing protein [soil metagenome]